MRTPCGIVRDSHRSGLIARIVRTRSKGHRDSAVVSRGNAATAVIGLRKLARSADALNGQSAIAGIG
jgi:hypothetical protein